MNVDFPLLQALVKETIRLHLDTCKWGLATGVSPRQSSKMWTVQGFGMMRLNLEKVGRIHIWDQRLRVPGMNSDIHTHPWNLWSLVISGEIRNFQYVEGPLLGEGRMFNRSELQTGEGGKLLGETVPVYLENKWENRFSMLKGEHYSEPQGAIHRTAFSDGTVTLIRRDKGPPDEKAYVYWPLGQAWMTAHPRPATVQEVIDACEAALKHWG